jgi:hypothetical protein
VVESVQPQTPKNRDLGELPQATAARPVRTLAYDTRTHADQKQRSAAASASGGGAGQAIGDHRGVPCSRVSRIVGSPAQLTHGSKRKTPVKSG